MICGLKAELSNIDPNFYGYDARAMAMGGAFVSLSDRPTSVIWNPAGLNMMKGEHNIAFDNSTYLKLIAYNFYGYGHKLNEKISLAGCLTYSGDRALSEITLFLSGAVNGTMFVQESSNYYVLLKKIDIGLNLKYYGNTFGNNDDGIFIDENGLNHQVTGTSSGFGIDLGLLTRISTGHKIGLLWRNPLTNITWKSENEIGTAQGKYSESYPPALVFGYSYDMKNTAFSLDLDKSIYSDTDDKIKSGLEYRLFKNIFALRTGYSQELFTANNKKLSFGTGFNFKIWKQTTVSFDLAYQVIYEWEGHNVLRISCNLIR